MATSGACWRATLRSTDFLATRQSNAGSGRWRKSARRTRAWTNTRKASWISARRSARGPTPPACCVRSTRHARPGGTMRSACIPRRSRARRARSARRGSCSRAAATRCCWSDGRPAASGAGCGVCRNSLRASTPPNGAGSTSRVRRRCSRRNRSSTRSVTSTTTSSRSRCVAPARRLHCATMIAIAGTTSRLRPRWECRSRSRRCCSGRRR